MSTTVLYFIYAFACLLGLTNLLTTFIIRIYYSVFRERNLEMLQSFLGGFILWCLLTYLWKVVSNSQMPQLAIIICIVALAIRVFLRFKSKSVPEHINEIAIKQIFSQIGSLVIILIASFFMYSTVKWI
jgi:hypothetical protein